MNYNELFEKYNLLLTENQKLKSENTELRKRLGFDVLSDTVDIIKTENNSKAKGNVSDSINNSNADDAINKFSSADIKIKLFRSLFKGREDVFARRWESKTTAKSGYQPVCGNEWVEGVCDKRKYKCSACPNRKLLPITDNDIYKHLSGKDEHCRDVRIYDYVDIRIPVLEKMYQKRLKSYMSIGYKIKVDTALQAAPDLIYDGRNFYREYCEDIKTASRAILIVSPFMRKGRVTQLLTNLTAAILNGVDVTVITRPPEDFREKEQKNVIDITEKLAEYGVKVKYRSGFHQKFTVIDNEIVWYGSVNFLSFGIAEESIMRFASADIAGQLMDTVV